MRAGASGFGDGALSTLELLDRPAKLNARANPSLQTGVDIYADRIVELAAIHAPEDPRFCSGCFSSLLRAQQSILTEKGKAAAKVHGITNAEIAEAPDFKAVWSRFLFWVEDLLEMAVADETDSENEEPRQTQLLSEPPLLLLGGHNSIRFTGQLKFVGKVSSGFSGNRIHPESGVFGSIRKSNSSGAWTSSGIDVHRELTLVGTMQFSLTRALHVQRSQMKFNCPGLIFRCCSQNV